jgi:hypothetical protein
LSWSDVVATPFQFPVDERGRTNRRQQETIYCERVTAPMDRNGVWAIGAFVVMLLSVFQLLSRTAEAGYSGKCAGRWAIHACAGGNGKRSQAVGDVTQLSLRSARAPADRLTASVDQRSDEHLERTAKRVRYLRLLGQSKTAALGSPWTSQRLLRLPQEDKRMAHKAAHDKPSNTS